MNEVTKNRQGKIPWCMMFANDKILVEENLEEDNNRLVEGV